MDNAAEIRDFLTTRRAKITPERAGLPTYGRQRRVSGLRREEVSLLAGISVEYYTRIERGNARGVSEDVLDGVCRALQLDEAEREHLADLVRLANTERPSRRNPSAQKVRPSLQRIVDAMEGIPAFIRNGRLDILYANPLAAALYSDHFSDPVQPPNSARFAFLDPRARTFFVDWDQAAHDVVAQLRGEAGRNPYDRILSDLVGLLSTRSDEFRVRWATHDVFVHRSGTKHVHHPLVGDMTLAYEGLDLPADPGLVLVTYSTEPGSPSEAALHELQRWSSTRVRLSAVEAEAQA
jgi:transcriptional regulator with XRE-family HTH domain